MKKTIKLLLVVWTIGLLGGLFFSFLKLIGKVKIQGYEKRKLIPGLRGLILIFNHPSLWEPALLPFLFFPLYLFNSKFIPISTPDKINYYQKWWFWPIRSVCLPIERGNPREEIKFLRKAKEILNEGGIIILAPEGGRTFKGKDFKTIRKGKIEITQTPLKESKRIRRFKAGISWLIVETKASILPVWTEGGEKVIPNRSFFPSAYELVPRLWKKEAVTEIKIGEPFSFSSAASKEAIINFLENTLLRLGES